ncbi:MAG: histidine kinase N-terminal domain-containing protein [Anaerolineae bacterium]|nr:histidine kinase N-terminal domain-containing protein [Anaerolineae bacterium]
MLTKIAQDMPFVADVSRSDILLYARRTEQEMVLVAQASPHSTVPIHAHRMSGRRVTHADEPVLFRALRFRVRAKGNRRVIDGGAPVIQEVWPVRGDNSEIIGALTVEASLIAYVRHKTRSKVFQRAVRILQVMLLAGLLENVDSLSPFTASDGLLVADNQHIIRYASGIATEQYRKLGYLDNLVGRSLSSLDTGDEEMCARVLQNLQGCENEFDEHQRSLVRKAVPLIARHWQGSWYQPWKWFQKRPVGILFAIHDATEEKQKARELEIKSAMIREIHHRVKNNLQTVAAILRMQSRRSHNVQVKQILGDSVGRIMSMAAVHEYLSREEGHAINIREVARRIIQQTKEGVLTPEKQIKINLEEGNNLYLPARQATACALIINELVQNSVEHGYEERNVGTISISLLDEGEYVCIAINDDGEGLPSDFDLGHTDSMGLKIVQTLVQEDLGGVIEIKNSGGVQATVRFSKKVLEGEENWNEQG